MTATAYMTEAELASALGVAPRTLRSRLGAGLIPRGERGPDGRTRWSAELLDQILAICELSDDEAFARVVDEMDLVPYLTQ